MPDGGLALRCRAIEATRDSCEAQDTAPAVPGALADAVAAIGSGPDAPPGVCLAVSRAGDVAVAASGVAQAFDDAGALAAPEPMGLDTRTDLGSVTKVLATTTALMALAGAGRVSVDLPLAEVLPWTAASPVGAATLVQLLEHRAGLWEWWPLYLAASDADAALAQVIALPLRHPRGDARHYSDLGFQLLGAVVTTVADADLATAVHDLVLAPLGLDATRFAAPALGAAVAASSSGDRIERRMIATGEPYPVRADAEDFSGWRSHILVGEVNDGNAFHAFGSVAGHAGLFSSARDLVRFGDALLTSLAGDGPIDAAVARRFLRAGADPVQGLGFRRFDTVGTQAWGHTGFPGVAVALLPELGASVALVTNRLHVEGDPRSTEPMWETALRAAVEHLRTTTPGGRNWT